MVSELMGSPWAADSFFSLIFFFPYKAMLSCHRAPGYLILVGLWQAASVAGTTQEFHSHRSVARLVCKSHTLESSLESSRVSGRRILESESSRVAGRDVQSSRKSSQSNIMNISSWNSILLAI